jgi:hypothetical protein
MEVLVVACVDSAMGSSVSVVVSAAISPLSATGVPSGLYS